MTEIVLFHALPPLLYEVLNCATATIYYVALIITLRYMTTGYLHFRLVGNLSRWDAFKTLRTLKFALGFLIFLLGECPSVTWVWLARFLANTGRNAVWMGQVPWVFVPVAGSAISVFGMACIVRALVPEVWGRFGYWVSLGTATAAVVVTQVFR